jgi:hypothetical protein
LLRRGGIEDTIFGAALRSPNILDCHCGDMPYGGSQTSDRGFANHTNLSFEKGLKPRKSVTGQESQSF